MRDSSDIRSDIPNSDHSRSATVDRALAVLVLLRDAREPLRLSEITVRAGLGQSATHRLLTTLAARGFVQQDASRLYGLGFEFLKFADAIQSTPIVDAASPTCRQLHDESTETVTFQLRAGRDRVVVQEFESNHQLRHHVGVGTRLPLYASASGRAILAFLSPQEITNALEGDLKPLTARTTTNRSALEALLEEIRSTGLSRSEGEAVDGIHAISTPVFGRDGTPVGSIAVSAPALRASMVDSPHFAIRLLHAGLEVSRRVGFSSSPSWLATAVPDA